MRHKPGFVKCIKCGREQRTLTQHPTCIRRPCGNPGPRQRRQRQRRGRLGTWTAMMLRKVGITRYRYTKFLVFIHLKKYGELCGCYRRKEKLNNFGEWVMNKWDSFTGKVAA